VSSSEMSLTSTQLIQKHQSHSDLVESVFVLVTPEDSLYGMMDAAESLLP
jgi:hypothetical protein